MSFVEDDFRAELAAHYKAVHARLWRRPPLLAEARGHVEPPSHVEPIPPPPAAFIPVATPCVIKDLPISEVAARWRKINARSFGGHVSPKSILYITAAYFKFDVDVIVGKDRTWPIVRARQCAMVVMRNLCCVPVLYREGAFRSLSFPLIGKHFGRHHSTVLHAIRRTDGGKDLELSNAIGTVTGLLTQRDEA